MSSYKVAIGGISKSQYKKSMRVRASMYKMSSDRVENKKLILRKIMYV